MAPRQQPHGHGAAEEGHRPDSQRLRPQRGAVLGALQARELRRGGESCEREMRMMRVMRVVRVVSLQMVKTCWTPTQQLHPNHLVAPRLISYQN